MKKNNPFVCPVCGNEEIEDPKQNYIGGYNQITCKKCDYSGFMPLWTSTKMFYWTATISVFLILLNMAFGGGGRFGLLAVLAPYFVFNDWRTIQKINKIKKEKKLDSKIFKYKEKYSLIKGLIYSVLIVFFAFVVGPRVLNYGKTTDSTVNSPTPKNTISNNKPTIVEDTWVPQYSIEGKVKINFPEKPTVSRSNQTIKDIYITITQYDSTAPNGDSYMGMVAIYDLTNKTLDTKVALEGAVNGSVNSYKGNKLVSSSFNTFKQAEAVDFIIYNENEKIYMKGKNILKGNKLYTLLVASKIKDPPDYQRFIDGFEFTE